MRSHEKGENLDGYNGTSHEQDDKPQDSSATSSGHKRSLSGSILSKLSFLRASHEPHQTADEVHVNGEGPRKDHDVKAGVMQQQVKNRKRKGSLRKTALLGTGKHRLDGRERKGSNLSAFEADYDGLENGKPDEEKTPTSLASSGYGYRNFPTLSEHESKREILSKGDSNHRANDIDDVQAVVVSPTFMETSTTDEEEGLTLPRHASISLASQNNVKKPLPDSDSYFPSLPSSIVRRRTSNKTKSPLATLPGDVAMSEDEWDYSVTEWWGWVLLVVTWVVFVVGMGSCLELWSWAWDVGETPYAPPELEDDPTLPIVGYYPALIILTAVMAWVWVVVAWVGMKYFKHAKISGEDV